MTEWLETTPAVELRSADSLTRGDLVAVPSVDPPGITAIYFIQDGEDGPIKIGSGRNPWLRLEHLQIGNPRELHIRAVVRTHRGYERELHQRFAAHRIRGEWFEPVPDLLALIEESKP